MGFSLLDDQTFALAVLSTVMAAGFIYYLFLTFKHETKIHKLLVISLSLVIGGTLGNMIDRWLTVFGSRGGVIDFLEFYIFGSNNDPFAIFNIADASLVVGVILLIFEIMFRDTKNKNVLEVEHKESVTNETKVEDNKQVSDFKNKMEDEDNNAK